MANEEDAATNSDAVGPPAGEVIPLIALIMSVQLVWNHMLKFNSRSHSLYFFCLPLLQTLEVLSENILPLRCGKPFRAEDMLVLLLNWHSLAEDLGFRAFDFTFGLLCLLQAPPVNPPWLFCSCNCATAADVQTVLSQFL